MGYVFAYLSYIYFDRILNMRCKKKVHNAFATIYYSSPKYRETARAGNLKRAFLQRRNVSSTQYVNEDNYFHNICHIIIFQTLKSETPILSLMLSTGNTCVLFNVLKCHIKKCNTHLLML